MYQCKKNTKGVSLPLIIGLVTLLLVASMAINELIIRNMRSVQRIEASNKAYMAAEAGIEDALYELTPHFAGYETGAQRTTVFDTNVKGWENKWSIKSISGKNEWPDADDKKQKPWLGKIYKNQKLIIALFKDEAKSTSTITNNEIDTTNADIETLTTATDFEITFTIPASIDISTTGLKIDNDKDGSLNEDAVDKKDDDGDGQIDEDSDEDPVILWKLTDGGSRTLIPTKGCLGDKDGSEICEKDFDKNDSSIKLQATHKGKNTKEEMETIGTFIQNSGSDTKLHFEFLIVAPMEHVDDSANKNIIPYIEYTVKALNNSTNEIPYPKFTIQSDGYYRKFKQTIIATLTPKMTVPLFDFTIIQQD